MDFTQVFNADLWASFFQDWDQFAQGFLFSLLISIGALLTALFLGVIFGAMSTTKSKVLRFLSRVYVEFYQNTPLLVQFVIIYYGLSSCHPFTGLLLSVWDSTTEPISLKSFGQGLRLCRSARLRQLSRKALPILKPCG